MSLKGIINNIKRKRFVLVLLYIVVIIMIISIAGNCLYHSIEPKGEFSNRFYSDLKQVNYINTVCMFIPHPDDEIWLAGSTIKGFEEAGIDVHVVIYTTGRSSMLGERDLEFLKSCMDLGVKKDNLHYLGFENHQQFDEEFPRGTSTPELRDSIKYSIKNAIINIKPQLVIASDFDFNRDHRLYSILFDEAIGEMLHEHQLPKTTLVWKGFCYNTSYYSENDYYNSINLLSTIKPTDVQNSKYETDVPQFLWKDRLRIPIYKDALSRSHGENYIFDAISNHVTQHVHLKYMCSVNSDVVLWQRNVDNLFNNSSIHVSSGNSKYLTDFKFYDSDDIRYSRRYNVNYVDCIWSPDDEDLKKKIDVIFDKNESIQNIILYDNPSLSDNILSVEISVNDSVSFIFDSIDKKGAPSTIRLERDNVKNLSIKVVSYEGENAGFVEIEALKKKELEIVSNKICDREGNFIYKAFVPSYKEPYSLTFYSSNNTDCEFILNQRNTMLLSDSTILFDETCNKCTVSLKDKNTGKVYDTVEIERLNGLQEWYWGIYKWYDEVKLRIGDKIERNIFIQKLLRIIHYPEGL